MIPKSKIMSTLFFDIETTTRYKTFEEYLEQEPFMAKEFIYRCSIKGDYKGMDPAEVYTEFGMLYPEHGQVVSIAYKIADESGFVGETIGFTDWEDYEKTDKKIADKNLLIRFNEVLHTIFGNDGGTLGGYRINYFDVPYLYKRMLISGLFPHSSLITVGKKPWNLTNLELYDYWNGVGVNGMSGFGSACELMGVPNSKDDEIDGRQVCFRFWDDHNVDMINRYCMRDVESSIRFAIALSDEKLKNRHHRTMEEWVKSNEETKEEDNSL